MMSSSSSPEHQAKKIKLNEDSIYMLSSSHPLPGPAVSDDDFQLNQSKLKHILSSLFVSSSYSEPLYPLTFIPTMSISDYVTHYSSFDDLAPAADVSLAGLIMKKLTLSESTFIYELHCLEFETKAQVQVIAKARNSYMDDAGFSRFQRCLKPGVFLGVSGLPGKSENGDLVIFPSSYVVLTREPKKELPDDPDWDICFKSKETASLERYRDIMMDKDVAPIFKLRYKISNYIARILIQHSFFEVFQTLLFYHSLVNFIIIIYLFFLKLICPFITREETRLNIVGVGRTALSVANDHYASYFNRAPSLEKMSCGHDYAYELGQQILNGGFDLSHFTKVIPFEFWVDFDFNDLMTFTERVLSGIVKDRRGGYRIKCHANGLNMDPMEIDFNPPFSKINIMEELDKLENLEKPEHFSVDATNKYLSRACSKYNISCSPPQTTKQLLDKLVKHFLEKCVNPTFIIYHPNIMSPMGKCGLTQRFELFINKHEVFNGYATLEDRSTQIQRIWNIKNRPLTESEEISLEHGLVSTGGWSLGTDRLTMLLANSECTVEEVPTSTGRTILFRCSAAEGKDVSNIPKVHKPDQAHGSSKVSGMFAGTQDKCVACKKAVYPLEKVAVDGTSYHKSCFKCTHGGCVISPSNYVAHEHILYCKHHHTELFKEKGNFNQLGNHETLKGVTGNTVSE